MSNDIITITCATFIGLGATLVMDTWALFLQRVFNIASLNYAFVGRWVLYMPKGIFKHAGIFASSPKRGEHAVGWTVHYLTGVIFTLALIALTRGQWLYQPTLLPALLVGIFTVGFPFFIMQPAFGLGVAGAKTPTPNQTRVRSLMAHCVFGIGLYICALPISLMLRAYT
ncbi:Uncharacterised protein [BD1-7 clade bacterium]|uniref:DUF2938 domain-containing protein n=1 Tax=BD1-7 clade bacterium TaxID=2029982 RepID=A0A5S9NQ88_9GAMM|nr:Uncharacterised protein [BD1-7 clade bacterium]